MDIIVFALCILAISDIIKISTLERKVKFLEMQILWQKPSPFGNTK